MALPTFNGFSLQDENFITERVNHRQYADREVIRAKVNRREGVKLVATEFGSKEITVTGNIVADSAADLQSLVDNLKLNLTAEEADLIIETGRTYRATVMDMGLPDEHYNQSVAPFEITFLCSDPFALGEQVMAVTPVTSGIITFSGSVVISGTLFARPTITYTPPTGKTGPTGIARMDLSHTPTGQQTTVSGFNSGTSLRYQDALTINMDDFTTLEGSTEIENSGSFPRWEPGVNNYTVTVSGKRFPGGTVTVSYQPRYL